MAALKDTRKEDEEAKKAKEAAAAAEGGEGEGEQKMSKAQLKKLAKQKYEAEKKAKKAAESGAAPVEEEKKEEEKKEEVKGFDWDAQPDNWKDRHVNYKKDFFGKPAMLTVSGQLAVENYACAMSDAYTFGPTFRAENSHTARHLAEFWMIEPELSFINFDELKDCAEDYLKFCLKYALENNLQDIEYLEQFEKENVKKGKSKPKEMDLVARLRQVIETPFMRLPYTEAVEVLKAEEAKAKFVEKVEWGIDFGSEHERWLVEKVYKRPVILTDYPKKIKAFYMRVNDDDNTCQAMDILAPEIGEIIGGSMREERLDKLDAMLAEKGLP